MMRTGSLALGILLMLPAAGFGQAPAGPLELTSELGHKLYGLDEDQKLSEARAKLAADPKNIELMVALSKAQAARRLYREAVATDTAGLALAPANGALLLERGHYELGLREFAAAKQDLLHAAQSTPDVLEVFYHLGLAHYFLGEFAQAAEAFGKARSLGKTDDNLISSSNWLYASLRRAGKGTEAKAVLTRITPEVKNTDPHDVFYLRLLHFYQGKLSEQEVLPAQADDAEGELAFDTTAYAVGNWNLYNGKPNRARELFSQVVQGQGWNSFGFIGAELELKRMK